MDRTHWERVQALFHAASEMPPAERGRYLEQECAGDEVLIAEVLGLLDEDARGGSLLDRGLADSAEQLVGDTRGGGLGRRFGPYRTTGVIGEGGMGLVYLAQRPDLGNTVAIKVLRDASLSPARRERFASEQRTLAQLNHPSIAQLHDADTLADGTPWFAMEYIEGLPLTAYCKAHDTSLEGRLLLFRAVCEAVQHAHRHLVVHRDLKPSNILVKDDGTVKLLDFGIAKHLERLDAPVDQTKTGLRLMTPAYAAPEQLRGDRVGIHTDVYSLGVILYELLTEQLPFDLTNATPGEAERVITEKEPVRPSVVSKHDGRLDRLSASRASWADLDVLCLVAMHKDPQRRYRTVDALIRDIDHYLSGEPLEARADTIRYRAGKFMRRNRNAVVAGGMAIASLIGLVGFYTVRLANAKDAALAEATRTQRIQSFMLSLFQGGDEQVGPADSLRVVSLLGRGVDEARSLHSEPAVQAELLHTLGGLYQKLGQLDRADSLLVGALEQRRLLHGPDHPDVAKSEVALGELRLDQAAYEDAEQMIRGGLEKLRRAMPAGHPAIAKATTALGTVLEERGEYDQAISVLEDAVRLHGLRGDGSNPDLTSALTELGNTHFYAGNFPTADSIFRHVLALDRRLYGERHPAVANDLINVGAVQHERGQYPDAERFYRQALDINRGFYGEQHPKTAQNLTMLGRSLIFQRRLDEAGEVIRQAITIQERIFGNDHPVVASTVNELGSVALMQDRLDEAEAAYTRMVRIYRTVYPPPGNHYLIGIAVSNLASVQLTRERYPEAERLFKEAVDIFSDTQSPEHLNTGIARIKLGRAMLRQRRYREAVGESLAGYEILAPQTDPKVSWLQTARRDLVAGYDALDQPERAERFRQELADTLEGSRE